MNAPSSPTFLPKSEAATDVERAIKDGARLIDSVYSLAAHPESIGKDLLTEVIRFYSFCNERGDVVLEDEVLRNMESFCMTVDYGRLTDVEKECIDEIKNYFFLLAKLMTSRRSESESVSEVEGVDDDKHQDAAAASDSQSSGRAFAATIFDPMATQNETTGPALPGATVEGELPTAEAPSSKVRVKESAVALTPTEYQPGTIEWSKERLLAFVKQEDTITLSHSTINELSEIEKIISGQKNGEEVFNIKEDENFIIGLMRLTESVKARVTSLSEKYQKNRMGYTELFAAQQVLMLLTRIKSNLATFTPGGVDGERSSLPGIETALSEVQTEEASSRLSEPVNALEPLASPSVPSSVALSEAEVAQSEPIQESLGEAKKQIELIMYKMRQEITLLRSKEQQLVKLRGYLSDPSNESLIEALKKDEAFLEKVKNFVNQVVASSVVTPPSHREVMGGFVKLFQELFLPPTAPSLESMKGVAFHNEALGLPRLGTLNVALPNVEERLIPKEEGLRSRGARVLRSGMKALGRLVGSAKEVGEKLVDAKDAVFGAVRIVKASLAEGVRAVKNPESVRAAIKENYEKYKDVKLEEIENPLTTAEQVEESLTAPSTFESDILTESALFTKQPEEEVFAEGEKQKQEEVASARKRLLEKFKKGIEWYDGCPNAEKYLLSASLLAVGIIGTTTGVTALTGVAIAGRVVLRAVGAASLGMGTTALMRGQNKDGNALSRFAHNNAGKLGIAAAVIAFLAGNYGDYVKWSEDSLLEVVPRTQVEEYLPMPEPQIPEVPLLDIPDVLIDVPIQINDTAVSLLSDMANGGLRGVLGESFGVFEELGDEAKKKFVENLLANIPKDSIRDLGISSGSFNAMSPGELFKFDKLAEIAEKTKIFVNGQETNLIERAFEVAKK